MVKIKICKHRIKTLHVAVLQRKRIGRVWHCNSRGFVEGLLGITMNALRLSSAA
jgi:hypothetical protein